MACAFMLSEVILRCGTSFRNEENKEEEEAEGEKAHRGLMKESFVQRCAPLCSYPVRRFVRNVNPVAEPALQILAHVVCMIL